MDRNGGDRPLRSELHDLNPIPFEPQRTIDGSRTCGAAALTMVYRSLGLPCEQLVVWQRVAEEIRTGVKATRTHRLALDACNQGLPAVTLQAEQPDQLLARLLQTGSRVILNHRLDPQSQLGHYSVLLRFDGHKIEIHDPHHGPNRVLPWPEFAELWKPSAEASEIIGHVLVAIGVPPRHSEEHSQCGHELPSHWTCPRCDRPIPTSPADVVRYAANGGGVPLWKRLFCPHCDWAIRS